MKDMTQSQAAEGGWDQAKLNSRIMYIRARVHGIEAVLHSNRARGYTDGFKLSVVHSVIEEKLPWTAAGIRFNLRRDLIKSWVGKYLTGGEEKLKRENLLLKKQCP